MPHRDPLLTLLLLLLFVSSFRAQPAGDATGLIEGRILNTAGGTYLEGARVTVEGTAPAKERRTHGASCWQQSAEPS
ncbi:MAG: hypothetical protein FJ399_22680 [Verrucomicrobia bacterium]|nr:hypothetical protein [Verrucomicrobiota bacterium]